MLVSTPHQKGRSMPLDHEEHKRLVEMKEDQQRDDDTRFLAECLWKINLALQQREDYEAEQAEWSE